MGYGKGNHNEILGKHHSIFVDYNYSKSDEYLKFWTDLRTGKIFSGIFERKKVDGSAIYLQASYNPIFDSKGNVTSIIKIAIDVTEATENKKDGGRMGLKDGSKKSGFGAQSVKYGLDKKADSYALCGIVLISLL